MAEIRLTPEHSPSEYRLVSALLDMPEGPLKARLRALLDELAAFARNPRCHEMQADGVPCEQPQRDCETCHVVLRLLDDLGQGVPRT